MRWFGRRREDGGVVRVRPVFRGIGMAEEARHIEECQAILNDASAMRVASELGDPRVCVDGQMGHTWSAFSGRCLLCGVGRTAARSIWPERRRPFDVLLCPRRTRAHARPSGTYR